jgi:hypothetical protein
MKELEKLTRLCPNCHLILKYSRVDSKNKAERLGSLCSSCANSNRIISEETKRKIAIANTGRICNDETRKKISKSNTGKIRSEKTKQLISDANAGKKLSEETKIKIGLSARNMSEQTRKKISNKLKGKPKTEEHNLKVSIAKTGKKMSDDFKKKISKIHTGRKVSNETRLNMSKAQKNISDISKKNKRLGAINRILNSIETGGQMFPNYNKNSIKVIEQKAKELGILDLQHAENGGEFYIKELGYWVDGYSKEKNIVIEYYEKYHNNIKERDIRRENEIINLLGCEFIVINQE